MKKILRFTERRKVGKKLA